MTQFTSEAETLNQHISNMPSGDRHLMQPHVQRLIDKMHQNGQAVPNAMRRLNDRLVDDAIEAQFDNMPV